MQSGIASITLYSSLNVGNRLSMESSGSALGKIFHELAKQKDVEILESHLCQDHVHICVSIAPKYSVSNVVGFLKGKSAISIARIFMGKKRNFTGQSFWARGYYVSSIGLDEAIVRNYIKNQEKEDERFEQLQF